ncbi:MAG: DUF4907 domain-containing protein [Raineya sp.]|jgi:hypothetical protein|nr:DUF4907 domain-containing protein [Raineya sp.]
MDRILFSLILILLYSCSQNRAKEENKDTSVKTEQLPETKAKTQELDSSEKGNFEVKIISSQENTFGYEIWIDGQKTIIQKTIPSVQGNKGFTTQEKAKKVAELVISKIKKNQMPPSVNQRELDSLGIMK